MRAPHYNTHAEGFTLIETMVAVSIFAIVVTVGVASLVSLNAAYRSARAERAVVDGLGSAIERMAREIRTGYQYQCNPSSISTVASTINAPDGACDVFGFMATEGGVVVPVIYALSGDAITVETDTNPAITITPSEVVITQLSFTMFGNAVGGEQPYVVIRIEGDTNTNGADPTHFSLQTLVTRRFPDTSVIP